MDGKSWFFFLRIFFFSNWNMPADGCHDTHQDDTQHNDTQHNLITLPLCWMSRFIYCYAESRYAECRGASWCPYWSFNCCFLFFDDRATFWWILVTSTLASAIVAPPSATSSCPPGPRARQTSLKPWGKPSNLIMSASKKRFFAVLQHNLKLLSFAVKKILCTLSVGFLL